MLDLNNIEWVVYNCDGGVSDAAVLGLIQEVRRLREIADGFSRACDHLQEASVEMAQENRRLRAALKEVVVVVEGTATGARNVASEMGCDAGNFDGGSVESCEHCQILADARHLEAVASRARAALEARDE